MKITGDDILALGFPPGPAIGLALKLVHEAEEEGGQILTELKELVEHPAQFVAHPVYGKLADLLVEKPNEKPELRTRPLPYEIYGREGIDPGAIDQMQLAMRLPVTLEGALMADAHPGYGLPIGGVLTTENSVIPYGVGVDIGCRVSLSVYDLPTSRLNSDREQLKQFLMEHTRFGIAEFKRPLDHPVLENPLFKEIKVVRDLKDKAAAQIGTSGGGNHFVEFGIVEIVDPTNEFGLPLDQYFALLSHSGSRGFGANIARHYTKVARELCTLPKAARHLAWLDLDTAEGEEYWHAMTLAGDYASACHEQIHARMTQTLGESPIMRVENHHNFAWKEKSPEGDEWIVHRKGATPATKGVLGVIPGSQTAPGFIVRGKGSPHSLNSAAHGAGRKMSRTKAKKILDPEAVRATLRQAGVEVIGSGLDEAPMAYKDIYAVMSAQHELVEILGTFHPKIVRMCGDKHYREVD